MPKKKQPRATEPVDIERLDENVIECCGVLAAIDRTWKEQQVSKSASEPLLLRKVGRNDMIADEVAYVKTFDVKIGDRYVRIGIKPLSNEVGHDAGTFLFDNYNALVIEHLREVGHWNEHHDAEFAPLNKRVAAARADLRAGQAVDIAQLSKDVAAIGSLLGSTGEGYEAAGDIATSMYWAFAVSKLVCYAETGEPYYDDLTDCMSRQDAVFVTVLKTVVDMLPNIVV
jgi:hypothetical protein